MILTYIGFRENSFAMAGARVDLQLLHCMVFVGCSNSGASRLVNLARRTVW